MIEFGKYIADAAFAFHLTFQVFGIQLFTLLW